MEQEEEQPLEEYQMSMFIHSSEQFLHENLWKNELTSEDFKENKK